MIDLYLYWAKNWIIMLWSKIFLFFGGTYSSECIPKGLYCYTPDFIKNKNREDGGVYSIIPCKYYKTLNTSYNGCQYLGVITNDMVFYDMCKMCGENLE